MDSNLIQLNYNKNHPLSYHMEIGQNKANPRGPLIAVIKIEMDAQRTDRIFLHQRDHDQQLAEQFVAKHQLNPSLTHHIYERIKFSRDSVAELPSEVTPRSMEGGDGDRGYSNSNYKLQTPVNHIQSKREPFEDDPSFGNVGSESRRYQYLRKVYQQPEGNELKTEEIEDMFTDRRQEDRRVDHNHQRFDPMSKREMLKDKDFFIYDQQEPSNEPFEEDLFGPSKPTISEYTQKMPSAAKKEPLSTAKKQVNRDCEDRWPAPTEQRGIKNALDIIKKQQTEERLMRGSKSMMKLNREYQQPQPSHARGIMPSSTPTSRPSSSGKPSHVKIMKKNELDILNQSLKKNKSRQEISRINRDVTQRLYNEVDIKKNYLRIIKEKAKKDKNEEIDPELTLKPQINKISKFIAEGRRASGRAIEDYLIEEGRKAGTKRAESHNRKVLKQIEQCSFKPKLNLISQKLAEDKSMTSLVTRKSRYCDENTYRPSLNKITTELMKDKGTFEQRQRQYLELKNEKLLDLVHERVLGQKIDLQTGQELFKPVIKDVGVRESQGTNIGNYLYHLNKECPESDFKEAIPKTSQSSQSMVQQMYMKRVTWLFSELDSDQDGLISSQKICIDSISPDLLLIIKPILFEMEEISEELTLLEFKNAIEILHRKLNLADKSILYNYNQRK